MNRNKSHWILLLLTLTVSASLLHEVIVHENSTCSVCVQFHHSPPAIDNPNQGFVIINQSLGEVRVNSNDTTISVPCIRNQTIRAPPKLIS